VVFGIADLGECQLDSQAGRPTIATVLVVDDDRVVAEMYRLALSRAGNDVLVANDGLAALRLALSSRPDFIFLDIRMPKMDGIEVLRSLGATKGTSNIPVAMLSNYDEPGLVRECLGLGAKEYLVKAGTNPADLGRIVTHWVRSTK
jgi:CheY-like chemotaxis protein